MPTPDATAPLAEDDRPDEIRQGLAVLAAATDTPAPGEGTRILTVPLSHLIGDLGRTVGMILHPAPIFRFGESIVTVDEAGKIEGMDPVRFTSWVETYLNFTRPIKDTPRAESIGKDKAAQILKVDAFRSQLRELKAVAEVRLPVWRGEGDARTVELAPDGFDASTGIYTVNSIPYPDDVPHDHAWAFIWDTLKEFPFDLEGAGSIHESRSFSAQLSAMLGVFCYQLFPEGTPRPMVVYNANQPGSGKSLLMRLSLAPVHGPPAESGKPETENEFEKVLDSAALARKPHLVLDDCKSIHSQTLNRFVTSPVHECRLMHSQRLAMIPKVTQVWATGNDLTVSEDLDRRALVVDLFESKEAASRKFAKEITPAWLFKPETRARFLASLWALVRTWRDQGMPPLPDHRRASFEDWTNLIGGIVMTGSFHNPFAPRRAEVGGDESGRALKLLLGLIAGEAERATVPTPSPTDILARAESEGLLEIIVGFGCKDPKKALGNRLKKLRGRHLVDSQGRAYEFGRRELTKGAVYPIRFL